jgi:hypothetical protein
MDAVAQTATTPPPPVKNRRRHPRFAIDGRAEIVLPTGGLHYAGRIVNLSLVGCFIAAPKCNFERGTYVEVYFEACNLKFRIPGNVANLQPEQGVGIAFQPMSARREADLRQLIAEISQ